MFTAPPLSLRATFYLLPLFRTHREVLGFCEEESISIEPRKMF
jgi:hypothetical protein